MASWEDKVEPEAIFSWKGHLVIFSLVGGFGLLLWLLSGGSV